MTGAAVANGQGLTPAFLTDALAVRLDGHAVAAVELEPVGTGQVSDSFRLHLGYDGPADLPATMVAKVPAADSASRAAARAFRTYEIEASFYGQLAAGLPVSLATCFYAGYEAEPDEYVVLLADLAPAEPGDQLHGLSPEQAGAAIAELAALHAAGWGSPDLAALAWLNRGSPDAAAFLASVVHDLYPGFRDRYAERVQPGTLGLIEEFLPRAAGFLAGTGDEPVTIVHGDFRADNLLFGGPRPVVVDWQTCSYGNPAGDLAYFLGSSLPVARRRQYEEALVAAYHSGLTSRGIELSWSDCWNGYRRHAFSGIVMDIVAAMVVQRTDRGDQMFATMASRHARHAVDLDSLALLP